MNGLAGHTFIIAGGATGIGAATASKLTSEGANVVIGDINIARAARTTEELQGPGRTMTIKFGLVDDTSVQNLLDEAIERFDRIDGLYNFGADLSPQNMGNDLDILSADFAVWRRTLDVNLLGYVRTTRALLPISWRTSAARSSTLPPAPHSPARTLEPPSAPPRPQSTP